MEVYITAIKYNGGIYITAIKYNGGIYNCYKI